MTDRIDIPNAFILADYSCALAKNILLRVEPVIENIEESLYRVYGVVTAENVQYHLTERGMSRRDARSKMEKLAKYAFHNKMNFVDILLKDSDVIKYLTPDEIREYSNPKNYTGESRGIIEEAHSELFGKKTLI
jgi:adenylosuccinate lyase